MRAIGQIPHQIAAKAFLAGAALLASASVNLTRAHAKPLERGSEPHSEELAMVLPRPAFPEGDELALPKPLPPEIATQVRAIFRMQRQGAFAEAIRSTSHLTDSTLLGELEASRYMNPAYHPSATELRAWLKQYASYADAPALWARLATLGERGGPLPPAPSNEHLAPEHAVLAVGPQAQDFTRNPMLDRTLHERTGWGPKGVKSALHLISITPGMKPAYAAQLQAEAAQAMLAAGNTDLAQEISHNASSLSHGQNALAGFLTGLALWQKQDYAQAAAFFEKAAHALHATADMRATCAFWAARAHEKLGDTHSQHQWLQHAAAFTRSFYGILAAHTLNADPASHHTAHAQPAPASQLAGFPSLQESRATAPASTPEPVLTEIDIEAVGGTEVGRRVFALLQVGEQNMAENAMRRAWPSLHDVTLARAFQLVAKAAGLQDLSSEMQESLRAQASNTDDAPLPHLQPRHGFTMDPALVYALARVESNFDPRAVSGAGAHGLMQIRAITADFVTSPAHSTMSHRFEQSVSALYDPGVNLDIGQRYVQYLAQLTSQNTHTEARGGDIIRLLASYNAGPSALAHWENSGNTPDDPLLFMELLPNAETRDYVHHTLAYLWRYAAKMKLPAPSLATLARNEWPDFADEKALASTMPRTVH
ncbi:transglycosylase SLT domain-containing protein [Acetobacter vaccinii]|uniref:Lytic transglycosylase domain-containing protein n=1 Tax=Acetobacter vaccinii TaxID=2592655 RepID=A0A5C1YMR5_9PROT|nr:lytic transglycosylase domain-containing protein [Acetobacter vaccinii]QEO17596.1 lytic transglycosylase domain-containing protein [Acetobacter vaccinii]